MEDDNCFSPSLFPKGFASLTQREMRRVAHPASSATELI